MSAETTQEREGGAWSLAEKIVIVTLIVGILHHADHVLRVDHSGWPFTENVNTFTYSLLLSQCLLE